MILNIHTQKALIANCFNKAAATYDAHCNVQRFSGHTLLEIAKSLNLSPKAIIDLGCGTGLITQKLTEIFNRIPLFAIDTSEQMLELAKARLDPYFIEISRLDFDELHNLGRIFDLVFSNMALHWSPNLAKTLSAIYQCLSEDGVLIFTIPLNGTLAEIKDYARQEFLSCQEVEQILVRSNLKVLYHSQQTYQENFANALKALKSIKKVGANYVTHRKTNISYPVFRDLEIHKNFTLTYNIGFFAVQKF